MMGAALVLSVVDARTGVLHLVPVEMAALHRRTGRYPALCGDDVITASMLTEPGRNCRDCLFRAQAGTGEDRQRGPAGRTRSRLSWLRCSRPGPHRWFRWGCRDRIYRNEEEGGLGR